MRSLCRYDDINEPKEVKFIDFQSARLCSLVTDILTFCFTSMSSTLRREYISQILEVNEIFKTDTDLMVSNSAMIWTAQINFKGYKESPNKFSMT